MRKESVLDSITVEGAKPMPAVIVFDLNGTLLDTGALGPQIRRIFGRKLSVDAWNTKAIQYSMAASLAGNYREFGELAMAVLEMTAAGQGVRVRESDIEKVKSGMKRLPPFPEVKKALRKLRAAGFRLAVLTNSSGASLAEQLQHSGLRGYFEQAVSVETVRRYKPALETYRAAAHSLGVDFHDMLMVAAHPWDLLGATRAGCRTAFLARPGKAPLPGAPVPEYSARNLNELADQLLAEEGSRVPSGKGLIASRLVLTGCGMAVGALGSGLVRVLRRRD